MNWQVFSLIGYLSVALWLAIPLLWVLHLAIPQGRWIAHFTIPLVVVAFFFAKHNSQNHVSLIQVDRTAQIQEQINAEAERRQRILDDRADEAAQVRFFEDQESDIYDTEGLGGSDFEYFNEAAEGTGAQPDWRQQREREGRVVEQDDDSIEAQIGATQQRDGVDASTDFDMPEDKQVIYMSESDVNLANRLNRANRTITRWALLPVLLFLIFDYVRRLNSYRYSYFPLPLPSAWANALNQPMPVMSLPNKPRRSIYRELRMITRRGDTFVYLTDDAAAASKATHRMPRLPVWINACLKYVLLAQLWVVDLLGLVDNRFMPEGLHARLRPVNVLNVKDNARLTDDFVFESLWFNQASFVIDSPTRANAMLERFTQLLIERRRSRAHTRQNAYILWDMAQPIPEAHLPRLASLCRATGFQLIICPKSIARPQPQTKPKPEPTPAATSALPEASL